MTQDAVQEFKVFRNQFDAQYGIALNAVVNVVTEVGRQQARAAPATTSAATRRSTPERVRDHAMPPFKQSRAGGTFGGPIVANRRTSSRRYEYLTIDKAAIVVAAGEQSVRGAAERQLSRSLSTEHLAIAKVDHRFNDTNSVFVRYAYDNQFTPAAGRPTSSGTHRSTTASRTASWPSTTGLLSQNMVNTLRVHYLDHNLYTEPDQLRPADQPAVVLASGRTASARSTSRARTSASSTTLSTQHAAGTTSSSAASSRSRRATSRRTSTSTARFTFTTDPPFDANDSARPGRSSFVQQTPGFYNYSSNQIAGFVQDDWRVTDRVRLNLGLRYDLDTNLRDNNFYDDAARQPALRASRISSAADRGNDYEQPAAARRRHLGHARATARWWAAAAAACYVTRNRPWFQQTSMDRTLGLVGAHHRPAAAAELTPTSTPCSAARRSPNTWRPAASRSLYLIDNDYVLPYSLNTTGGLGWQINASPRSTSTTCTTFGKHQLGTTRRNLPASGAVSAANPRPVPQFSQVGDARQLRARAGTTRSRCSCATRVRGTDSLQVSYTYSKSIARRRHLLQHLSAAPTGRPGQGLQPDRHAAQPERRGVDVAALGRAAERRVPRASAAGRCAVRRASIWTATSTRRTTGRAGLPITVGPRRRRRPARRDQRVPRHAQPGAGRPDACSSPTRSSASTCG